MYTTDDATFIALYSVSDKLSANKLIYYMYVYQMVGLDFNFKYKFNANGVVSRSLSEFITELLNADNIEINNNEITLTRNGVSYFDNIRLTADEYDTVETIRKTLDVMTESELYFICLTDLLINDVKKKYGVSGLISQKDTIKKALENLSTEYSEENFDYAIKFIRKVRRHEKEK